MRAGAVLGGAALVGAVVFWHHSTPPAGNGQAARLSNCEAAGGGGFCSAVAGLARILKHPALPIPRPDILPPPAVPGAIDPAVTQANIDETICRPGYAGSKRPNYAITGPLKRRMMDEQHPGEALADYELDHLVPIAIGGAPLDRRDLWLQPRHGQANAGDKNVLAYVLWRLVCRHQVPLETAQQAISRDWTKAYETYATPGNVANYHFRHSEEGRDRPDPATPE